MSKRYETRLPVSDIFLNVVEEGEGPTVVLLHGFPEFSFSWDAVVRHLVANYHVVAPDQRGYGQSDAPLGVDAYRIEHLVADIVGLIRFLDCGKVLLVGHDWGATVGWVVAQRYPQLLHGLMVINGPHPAIFARELSSNPVQRQAASYVNNLILPEAEGFLAIQNHASLVGLFENFLSEEVAKRYSEAYNTANALTGMLNWYRAHFDPGPFCNTHWTAEELVEIPTHVLWGMADQQLLPGNLTGIERYAADLLVTKVEHAGHWLLQEAPEFVANTITDWASTLALSQPS